MDVTFSGEATYRDRVRLRLEALIPVFARASRGDFSAGIDVPGEDDEFTDLFAGVQLMLEVIRKQLCELRELNGTLKEVIAARTSALADAQAIAHVGNALRQSEERYRRLVDSARDVIFTISPEGILTSLNPAFEEVTGWPRQRWLGRPYTALLHPDDLPSSVEQFRRLLKGEAPPVHQWRMATAAGSYVVGEVTSTPLMEGEKVVSILGIARDITERRRLQDRLDEVAARRTEELRMFATHVQGVQEEERRRIARELHDDLGQRLTGMRFAVEELEDALRPELRRAPGTLQSLKKQIDAMIAEIRRNSAHLHPAALDDFGLEAALRLLCREFGRSHRLKVRFQPKDLQPERYDPAVEIALYRIAQEALSNSARYAGAAIVQVRLSHGPGRLQLTVADDGKGFDLAKLQGRKNGSGHGLGLISMKERAEHFGGSCTILTKPNGGTTVTVEIPVGK